LSSFTFSCGFQTIGLQYFMGWRNTPKLVPIWVMRWCEGIATHHARPFNIKLGHYTSYLVWQWFFERWQKMHHEPNIGTTQRSFPCAMLAQPLATSPDKGHAN
jgi:hypothetical protein